MQNYLWCPNDPRGYGIDDDNDDDDDDDDVTTRIGLDSMEKQIRTSPDILRNKKHHH